MLTGVRRGESGVGTWTLVVRDLKKNEHQGIFVDWHLKLWGEAIDASKATKLPMPTEEDDADHDKITTVTAPGVTSTLGTPTDATKTFVSKPSDHPERPTKPAATTPETSATASPTVPPSGTDKFPPFGGSKTVTMWVIGAASLIAVFCIGLGIYFCIARKRQLRNNPRNSYEFELLDDEEGDGLNSGEKNKQARRTRGGELYDAFAGASDDEEDFDEYRDRSAERLQVDQDDEEDQYIVGEESDDEDDHDRAEARPLGGGSRL
jgi:kexin